MQALISNLIVQGKVIKIVKTDDKHERIAEIQCQFLRPLTLCHSSSKLYQDYHPIYYKKDPSYPLEEKNLNEYIENLKELSCYNPEILIIINKDRSNQSELYVVDQLINQIGLNQYGTMLQRQDNIIYDFSVDNFNPNKLRDMQNLDWAEDSIYQGLQCEQVEDFDKALEYYNYAIDLDPLSKDGHQAKGILLKKLERFEESEKALKEGLKLDPEDEDLEQILKEVMIINRTNQQDEENHSDRRKNGINKYEEQWEGMPISTGHLMTDIQLKHNDPIINKSHESIVKQVKKEAPKQYELEF
ncbi:tpr repeat protein [Stylonychia lemnae]|uniref:Tpr repeat protein n=1 Tax=Stylonychia lemnae TaxID=5949 RepID=A0A078ALP6_STYLE|nr:tpr repeat protein [Stylonychia lemnae]|eukprot:CDW82796.1 tpr repeat protein [Stylonychia lemnae]